MTKWRPHAPDIWNMKQFKVSCSNCPKGSISLSLKDYQRAEHERVRKKCSACKNWMSVYRDDNDDFYDITGKPFPEDDD